jgi:antibiotic biosynthesis monooxygenase (ABM) superfamily enzyme
MWAQLIKTRVKPGNDDRLRELLEQLRSIEQPDSGLLRSTAMLDQNDPSMLYLMVVFDNEEQARAREQDPRRAEGLQAARAIMEEILDGQREFVDLNVLEETIR